MAPPAESSEATVASYDLVQVAGRYVVTWPLNGTAPEHGGEAVVVTADRLRQHKDGRFTGRVTVEAHLSDGIAELHSGALNFVATRSKRELARALEERLDYEGLNWDQVIEETCREVVKREEHTEVARPLRLDVEHTEAAYLVEPLLLKRQTVLFYGPGGGGKSYVALFLAFLLENGLPFAGHAVEPTSVLYCDWEADRQEADRRATLVGAALRRRFGRELTAPAYRECVMPLVDEGSAIAEDMARTHAGLVIIDSAGPACGGDIMSAETAVQYFGALRKLCSHTHAASLTLTHITKNERREENGKRLPIGSIFFENYARATWEVRTSETTDEHELGLGLFCRKTNFGPLPSVGLSLTFAEDEVAVELTKAEDIVSEEGALQAMALEELAGGWLTAKELADKLGTTPSTVWNMLTRLKRRGLVTNPKRGKWAVLDNRFGDLRSV